MIQKPSLFLASPLFNKPQHDILDKMEALFEKYEFDYYSARKHSGSGALSLEEKKKFESWGPVFKSNEEGLLRCNLMIAVLEYAMPDAQSLCIYSSQNYPAQFVCKVEIPDSGTVFEVGHFYAQGKPVIGFHSSTRPDKLNLMLTHSTKGLVLGFDALEESLQKYSETGDLASFTFSSWKNEVE